MTNETHNILRILIENPDEKYSIRKLSKLRKINYKSAYQALMKLEEEGVVHFERLGNTINCSFSKRLNPSVFAVEYERKEEILKDSNLSVMCRNFKAAPYQFVLLLFGSQAKKAATRHSDIDLLAITEHGKEIERVVSLLPLNIHMTALSNKDFTSMAKSRELTVVSEAMRRNIILIGIEDYYRVLENAGRYTDKRSRS